jgi:coatomer protein complex subunit alpha (xenin)
MRVMCLPVSQFCGTSDFVSKPSRFSPPPPLLLLTPPDIDSLAYLTAKTNGLDDLADEILEANGLTNADIDDVPSFSTSDLKPPPIVTCTANLNWPSVSLGENFFDRALANDNLERRPDIPYANGIEVTGVTASSALDAWAKEEEAHDGIDPEEGGWELDAGEGALPPDISVDEVAAVEDDMGAGATPGVSETDLWIRNSPFAGDHVAAGSFDTAMQVSLVHMKTFTKADRSLPQLLNGQFGIANFSPLKPHFLSIYRSSRTFLSPLASLPPLRLNVKHNPAESSPGRTFPVIVRPLPSIRAELSEGCRFVSSNKLADAQTTFRVVLQNLLLVTVTSDEEAKTVGFRPLLAICD